MNLTAKNLYFWANDNLPNIQVFFHEYIVSLHDRFENSKTIPGISSMDNYIFKKL